MAAFRPQKPPLVTRLPGLVVVAGGGLIGSLARIAVGALVLTPEEGLPLAVLVVNLTGSLLLGFFLARRERSISGGISVRFWGIGVLGSFTTFSGFTVDVVRILEAGRAATALGYVLASVIGGLGAVVVGDRVGRRLS